MLRYIVSTDPASILNLPVVTRARNKFGRTKIELTEAAASHENRTLRMKSARLQAQLTKSNKRRVMAEGLASAARTRLTKVKETHTERMSAKATEVSELKAKEKVKQQEVCAVKACKQKHSTQGLCNKC